MADSVDSAQGSALRPARGSAKSRFRLSGAGAAAALRQPRNKSFPVVGIGASAGGLEAFTQLLRALPRKSGMAFVLVQHLAPRHDSALTSLLSHATQIPVTQVKDGMVVERDRIYVIPPNVNMTILDGRLHLIPRTPGAQHLPIDFFLRSLAEERGNKAIGVILSGTASDGTIGMKTIKAEGGITFAQDAETAKYSDMPRNAIAAGCVDFVLPPEGIAQELTRIVAHPYVLQPAAPEPAEPSKERDDVLRRIFVLLRTATAVDFSNYKHSAIRRRIKRRMMLNKCQTLSEYLTRLHQNPREVEALYQDILIHVTGFFRDPEAFKALREKVFTAILNSRPAMSPVRIWVPGCSTGEEVYSLGICLLEVLGSSVESTDIQIFGTDISQAALEKARAGVYAADITSDVGSDRLRRFFAKTPRGYQVSKVIRDLCVFARQDINKDPPFSRLDLISCRNLLIYFNTVLQKKVMPIFHYALKSSGYLFLGISESISGFTDLFSLVDKKHKIYAKRPLGLRPPLDFSRYLFAPEKGDREAAPEIPGKQFDVQQESDRVLLSRYVPAGVLVNADMEIVQFRGRTGNFLEPPIGQPSLSLSKMMREGLLPDVREAIHRALKEDAPVKKQGIVIRRDGQLVEVGIEVMPIKGVSRLERYFLVMFEDVAPPQTELKPARQREALQPPEGRRAHEKRNAHLEELAQTKSTLQSIIEEQETTNEELKSANEEILSSNEELQSTNEELETAKEELQSTNEELNTLNEELHNRNQELSTANNDLSNLLVSTSIPILILGNDLRIRLFTTPAEKLLNLTAGDLGRPLSDLRSNLIFNNLEQAILETIDSLGVREYEVRDNRGAWYSMRIRPYKTTENKLDGAVITWNDITTLKATLEGAEKALDASAERYRMLFERNLCGLFRLTEEGRFLECNSALARILGYESVASVMAAGAAGLFESPDKMNEVLSRLKNSPETVSLELNPRRQNGTSVWVLLNAFLVHKDANSPSEIEGIVLDISERKRAEESASQFSGWLLESQEEERKRISRDLHDTTGAGLTALVANLGLALKSDGAQDRKMRGLVRQSLKLAKQCSQEVRTLSYLLHPPLLEETGLSSALRWFVEGFTRRSGVQVDLDLLPDLERLPKEMEINLFRVVQECLTNIHRHSGSRTARIRLKREDGGVSLEVSDDGRGMSAEAAESIEKLADPRRLGVGIVSMRERVSQLGGKLVIRSGKNGTIVSALIPTPP